uniref:epoxide hydrolase family protein n=1 Tax=Rhodococcus sp. MEB041 TaxID=3040323 RepID=UPI00254E001C
AGVPVCRCAGVPVCRCAGVPVHYLRHLAGPWRIDYDWRAREARLNAFPQFTTSIDGTRIHFVHVRSPHPGALPLILTHGWPGSVFEFLDIIDTLTDPADPADTFDAFDVVVPSLPGFTLSAPHANRGTPTASQQRG